MSGLYWSYDGRPGSTDQYRALQDDMNDAWLSTLLNDGSGMRE